MRKLSGGDMFRGIARIPEPRTSLPTDGKSCRDHVTSGSMILQSAAETQVVVAVCISLTDEKLTVPFLTHDSSTRY